jgi:hypothetical protein
MKSKGSIELPVCGWKCVKYYLHVSLNVLFFVPVKQLSLKTGRFLVKTVSAHKHSLLRTFHHLAIPHVYKPVFLGEV